MEPDDLIRQYTAELDAEDMEHADLIGQYGARLDAALKGFWPGRARLLFEAATHLRDAAEAEVAAGVGEREAQRRALERFGAVEVVARSFAEERLLSSSRRTLRWFPLVVVPMMATHLVPWSAMLAQRAGLPFLELTANAALVLQGLAIGLGLVGALAPVRQPRVAGWLAWGLVMSTVFGTAGLYFSRLLMEIGATGSHAPWTMLPMIIASFGAFAMWVPAGLAQDAFDATVRKLA